MNIPYVPPNCSSAEACAVSPSARLTIHWYIPRSSLLIPFSLNNSDCLPEPGSWRPSLYQVTKCGPACGCVLTSHLNSALPPKWTLNNGGVTSMCSGAVTMSLKNDYLLCNIGLFLPSAGFIKDLIKDTFYLII